MNIEKHFPTRYGYFSKDGKEYIITDYKTPKPWINVISNGDYGLVISQTGGGFSWLTHSEFNKVNRWHQDMILDNWGKYFYIKDNDSGFIWSPTWMPVKENPDSFELHYGTGYAKFITVYKGIEIILDIFVPNEDSLEVWHFTIKNNTQIIRNLSIFTYFEWCVGSSADFHREFHKTFIETEFDSEKNSMFAGKRLWDIPIVNRGHWNIEYPYLGFLSCNRKIEEYESDKETFIGNYGSIASPKGLSAEKLQNTTGKWNDPIGTVKVSISLEPSSTETVAFYIGLGKSKSEIESVLKSYNSSEQIEDALKSVKSRWEKILGTLEIETPEPSLDILVNTWLRYQAIAGRLWGRTAYYQQSGAFGYRDQLQDSMVFLPIDPEETKKQIQLHARHQFTSGNVLHWWHPISETGLATEMTDDLLWLPYLLINYIEETGDYAILASMEPYYDDTTKVTLFDHAVAAIEKVFSRLSERGLTLIGAGDWNDGLSAVGLDFKGESIWLTEFFYSILVRYAKICHQEEKTDYADFLNVKAEEIKKSFAAYAWDGEWYWGATKDDGSKIGSSENIEGRIWLNTQTWAVLSGITDTEKQNLAMDAVSKYLLKDFGALLLQPAYSIPDENIGYLTRYAPGRRENGGTYTHAATWAISAFAKLKRTDEAFKACMGINPILNGLKPDQYVGEPFVTPGNIDGPDSPHYGLGGWTWYTGSAAWYQKVIVDWILGIRATDSGLLIDPCIPGSWKSYRVKRTYKNTIYHIAVYNESGKGNGVTKIIVEGEERELIPIHETNKEEVFIEVFLSN